MLELSTTLAANRDLLVGIGPFVIGLAVVGLLIAAFAFGRRQRAKEPRAPRDPGGRSGAWETPEEWGHEEAENHGPGHQVGERHLVIEEHEQHAPPVMPRDGIRRTPHHLLDPDTSGSGDTREAQQDRGSADPDGPRATG